jgi:spore germination protein YaaH
MPTQYTAVTGDPTGPLCTGVAVASGDTVNGNDVANGAVLVVTAAATPTNVTLVDAGHTPAGTAAAAQTPVTVAANTSRAFGKLGNYVDSTNKVTVNYSATTNVTAMLLI